MGKTKGVTVINYLAYVEGRTAADQVSEIKSRLTPGANDALFGRPIIAMSMVDYGAVLEFLTLADDILGRGDGGLIRQASRQNQLDNLTGIYRTLLPLASMSFVIKRAASLWSRYHDTGHLEVTSLGSRRVQLSLCGYPDIPPNHAPEIEGAYEGLVEVAKEKLKDLDHKRCVSRGDDRCEWELSW